MPISETQQCFRVDIEVTPEAKELVIATLFRFGVTSFEELSLDSNTPAAHEVVRCYFPSQEEAHSLQQFLQEMLPGLQQSLEVQSSLSTLDIEDWSQRWKEQWRGTAVGKRFFISPSWLEVPLPADRIVLTIDPEMAFGTGTHETTRMCLEWLEELVTAGSVDSFLDVGCGSGILSIAAAKLGVPRVVGIDIDENAVRTAQENAQKNGVPNCIFERKDLAEVPGVYSLICANIISSVLGTLWDGLCSRLSPSGTLIVSGLLLSERDVWSKRTVLRVLEAAEQGDWLSVLYGRQ